VIPDPVFPDGKSGSGEKFSGAVFFAPSARLRRRLEMGRSDGKAKIEVLVSEILDLLMGSHNPAASENGGIRTNPSRTDSFQILCFTLHIL
jgi:hypothetical protein